MSSQLLSIVIPAYREEKNISYIYGELIPVLTSLPGYSFEIIFVNESDSRVKGVNLSRNFGKELALFAGVEHARGDAIITMDADGQRPVKTIHDFIKAWESGSEIVYGVRTKMERSWIRKIFSQIFNSIMRAISSVKFDSAITDFMLLDKSIIPYLLEYRNKNIIFRGIVLDLGFHTSKVYFQEPRRMHGETAW
jgi:polyisoprenyl-phosphate glycosyltransferase